MTLCVVDRTEKGIVKIMADRTTITSGLSVNAFSEDIEKIVSVGYNSYLMIVGSYSLEVFIKEAIREALKCYDERAVFIERLNRLTSPHSDLVLVKDGDVWVVDNNGARQSTKKLEVHGSGKVTFDSMMMLEDELTPKSPSVEDIMRLTCEKDNGLSDDFDCIEICCSHTGYSDYDLSSAFVESRDEFLIFKTEKGVKVITTNPLLIRKLDTLSVKAIVISSNLQAHIGLSSLCGHSITSLLTEPRLKDNELIKNGTKIIISNEGIMTMDENNVIASFKFGFASKQNYIQLTGFGLVYDILRDPLNPEWDEEMCYMDYLTRIGKLDAVKMLEIEI